MRRGHEGEWTVDADRSRMGNAMLSQRGGGMARKAVADLGAELYGLKIEDWCRQDGREPFEVTRVPRDVYNAVFSALQIWVQTEL